LSGKLHTGFDLLRKENDKLNLRLENLRDILKNAKSDKNDPKKSSHKSNEYKNKKDRSRSRSRK